MIESGLTHQMLLDSIKTPVVALNRAWKVIYCNDTYIDFFGEMAREIEGKNLLEVFPEFVATEPYKAILKVLETGKPKQVEGRARGRYLTCFLFGIPDGVICIVEDTTEKINIIGTGKAQEGDYRVIFNEVNDGLVIYDLHNASIIDANDKACEMYGYSRKEYLQLNVADLSSGEPPYTRENAIRWMKKVASGMETKTVEWAARDAKGRSFWIELKSRRLEIDGEAHLLAVVRDITKEKQTERVLRESAERYQNLFDKADDLIFMHDMDGQFVQINAAAERLTGYWRSELLRMNLIDLIAPEYEKLANHFLNMWKTMAKRGKNKAMNWEFGIQTKHGSFVCLDVSAWLIYKSGDAIGVQGIARDITVRKAEDETNREIMNRLSDIVDTLPDALLGVDSEGRVIVWNHEMEKLTGLPAEQMIGKDNYEYSIPLYGERRPILIDLLARPEEVTKYYQVVEQDNFVLIGHGEAPSRGKGHMLWGKASPLYDRDGNIVGALETIREMTPQISTAAKSRSKSKKQQKSEE